MTFIIWMILLSAVYRIAITPMKINFLLHVSAHKDFFYCVKIFHSSWQIASSNNEAPKYNKIGI